MTAIYVRQSVDKKDSISIETQIEECKRKISINDDYEVFNDKGYSGATDNRPEFQRMMAEIRKGNIKRIIIYKLDRISRSLLDFLNMQSVFKTHKVELISCNENFDTSTSVGKLLLNLLMMFAEMERENIQQRIIDNYYARGEKGFYLGGPPPFGYNKIEARVNGKKTYALEANPKEVPVIQKIYSMYENGESLGAISRWLNGEKIPSRRGGPWNPNTISRVLRNPAYVRANADIYSYLKNCGAKMNNSVEDYVGTNGCYVYGNARERKGTKFANISNDYVSLGMHEGIIEPSQWLQVQYIFKSKENTSNLGTGSYTWLQGLVKCECGYTLYVKTHKNSYSDKLYRYWFCRGHLSGACTHPRQTMPVERFEKIAENALMERLRALQGNDEKIVVQDTPEINERKIKLSDIERKIENLLKGIAEGNAITIKYLNDMIAELDEEKQRLQDEILTLELKNNQRVKLSVNIEDVINNWKDYDLETKKRIAKEVIEKIVISSDDVDIIFY